MRLLVKLPLIEKPLKDALHALFVEGMRGGHPTVKLHPKGFPKIQKLGRALFRKSKWSQPFFLGRLLNLLTVLIHSCQKIRGPATQPFKPGEHIGQNLLIRMPNVRGCVGVIDGCGEKRAVWHGFWSLHLTVKPIGGERQKVEVGQD